jgi:hypothetical protein
MSTNRMTQLILPRTDVARKLHSICLLDLMTVMLIPLALHEQIDAPSVPASVRYGSSVVKPHTLRAVQHCGDPHKGEITAHPYKWEITAFLKSTCDQKHTNCCELEYILHTFSLNKNHVPN